MTQSDRGPESAELPEQLSRTGGGDVHKPVPARLVFSAVSENKVLRRREVIKRVTRDHEIVDVDGFVFKRKRRMPLSESANLPEAQAKRVGPCDKIVEEACVATSRRDADHSGPGPMAENACTMGQQAADYWDANAMAEMAKAALNTLPSEGVTEGARLMALCCKCVQDAVADAEGKPGARQLQEMLAAFLTNVEASLENGTLQAAEAVPASVAALQERKSLLVQLQSEQSLLQLRLQCFEQEEQEWLQLMKETENTAEAVSPAAATLGDAHIPGAVSPGRAAADPSSLTKGSDALPSGEAKADEPMDEQPAVVRESLRQAHMDTHRTLTFQVDGLCAMVEGVQDLVAKAEQISAQEFDTLFKKKFSALPGLNSPARLIREIVKPSSMEAGPSSAV